MINIINLIFLYEEISSRNSCDRWNQAKCLTAKIFWVPTKSSAPRTNALFTVCVVLRAYGEKTLWCSLRVVICIWHCNFWHGQSRVVYISMRVLYDYGRSVWVTFPYTASLLPCQSSLMCGGMESLSSNIWDTISLAWRTRSVSWSLLPSILLLPYLVSDVQVHLQLVATGHRTSFLPSNPSLKMWSAGIWPTLKAFCFFNEDDLHKRLDQQTV